jgi:pyruvate/2-oxoglutarate dehydrogenase complex dihydrolipoamide dehydrogenase (E3) component
VEALKAAALKRKLAQAPKDLSKEAREKLMKEPIEIGADELAALAAKRAEQVKTYLTASGRLPPDRVLVASGPARAQEGSKARSSRVDFALR